MHHLHEREIQQQNEKRQQKLSQEHQNCLQHPVVVNQIGNHKKPPPLVRHQTSPDLMQLVSAKDSQLQRTNSVHNNKIPTIIPEECDIGRRKFASQNATKK